MSGTTTHEWAVRPSVRVVEAVADAAGVDALSFETPLFDVVDTDALDRLVETGSSVRVTFAYEGHEVVVDGSGTVTVDGERAGDA